MDIQRKLESGYKERASTRNVGAVCSPELAEGSTAKSTAVAVSRFHKILS
jgi:hypothetical protein